MTRMLSRRDRAYRRVLRQLVLWVLAYPTLAAHTIATFYASGKHLPDRAAWARLARELAVRTPRAPESVGGGK